MVRRLFLAVLALLAVALPVAAEDAAPPPDSPEGFATSTLAFAGDAVGDTTAYTLSPACDLDPALCQTSTAWSGGQPAQSSESDENPCRAYAYDPDRPLDPPSVDPDSCFRALLRRTLGWPPTTLGGEDERILIALNLPFGP